MNILDLFNSPALSRYKMLKLIGKGAFGEVYVAFDRELRRNVAIKIFVTPGSNEDEEGINDFYREAILLAKVEHANIVPIYDVIRCEHTILLVMRFINGASLDALLKNDSKPIGSHQAYTIFRQILLGIDFSHSRGVIHLDMKPGNILMSMAEEVYVTDFGISQSFEDAKRIQDNKFGTPLFMSPEQISGEFMDQRSDIYSLGLLYYVMVTGNHPFAYCQKMEQLIEAHKQAMPVKPSYYNDNITAEIDEIIFKAIAKEPNNRYPNCWSLIEAMDKALDMHLEPISGKREFRAYVRVETALPARCQTASIKETLQAEIIDLSVGGASLLFAKKINVGGEINLGFQVNNFGEKTRILVKAFVVRQEILNNEWTQLAVKFIDLDNESKQALAIYVRNKLLDEVDEEEVETSEILSSSDSSKTLLM